MKIPFRFYAYVGILLFVPALAPAVPVRGVAGDLWADLVIGQPDFGELKPNEATNMRPWIPDGVFVDTVSSPQRLYIWDSGNSRILGFSNLANANTSGSNPSAAPSGADIVLGQPDFIHTSCNGDSNMQNYPSYQQPTASSLCGTSQESVSPAEGGMGANLAVDSQGNLYVPDYFNNRVLRYNAPVTSTEPAAYVWGRGNTLSDFTSGYNQCNPASANSLCLTSAARDSGVAIDAQGNLWVADSGHNRVLRFPNSGGVPSATADLVLGQSNFTNTTGASSLADASHMTRPVAVRVDASGNVFVADDLDSGGGNCLFHGRVLVFKAPVSSGMTASGILTNYLSWSMGLEFDPPSGGLWVSDFCNHQVILFNINLTVTPITFTPVKVLLRDQPSPDGSAPWPSSGDGPNFNYQDGSSALSYNVDRAWGGLGVDNAGDVFLTGVTPLQDVLRFPAPIPTIPASPTGVGHSADWEIFKPTQYGMENKIGPSGLESIDGIGVAATAGQLIVSDEWHIRYWNIPSGPQALANDQPADGYAGISSSQAGYDIYPTYGRIREDHASPQQHLWVVRNNSAGSGFLQVYNLPLTPWQSAAATLAQPIPVLGGGFVTWQIIQGFAPDPTGNYIWISDRSNSRVFRVRNPLGVAPSPTPVVDIILGQTSVGGNGCNQPSGIPSASNFCQPGAVAMDHHGNLYVGDHSLEVAGNLRLLRFDAATIQNSSTTACLFDIPASAVYGTGGSFTTTTCSGVNGVCGPFEPAFPSDDSRMVVGLNGYSGSRMPVVLTNPLSGDNPTATLNDFGSMYFSATFDSQDNLYTADMDRGRVLVYFSPFTVPTPTPSATPSSTPTGTWNTSTPTSSPTATPSSTPSSPTPTPTLACCQQASNWTAPALSGAAGVAVDRVRGRVYVPDRGTGSLFALDLNGNPVSSFGTNGSVSGYAAFSVAVGSCAYDGVYLVQRQNPTGSVVKLDASGNVVWTSANVAGGANRSIDVDNTGTVYVCNDGGSIYLLDNNGTLQNTLTGYGFSAPTGTLKVGSTLYVDDTVNNRIVALPQTGAYTYGSASVVVPSVTNPYCLAQDLAGNYYVASSNTNSFFVYDNGWSLQQTCSGSELAGAFGIAVDAGGAVYVAGQASNTVAKMQACYAQPAQPTCTPTGTWYTSTPTNSPSTTPSLTPTVTASFTPTASASFTPTASPTATVTTTPSFTETPSPTSTVTFTATLTASGTPTFTTTITPSYTPTPKVSPTSTEGCHDPAFYPNPVRDSDLLSLRFSPCDEGREVHVKIFTVVDRKVLDKDFAQVPVGTDAVLELKDNWGVPLANGLYYLVFDRPEGRTIQKLLILK